MRGIITAMNPKVSSSVYFFDVGTLNCRLYSVEGGLLADEPSVLLRHSQTGEIFFQGTKALALLDKLPLSLEPVRTVRQGMIADPAISSLFITMLGESGDGLWSKLFRPTAVVVVPAQLDVVHERALRQAFGRAGLGSVIALPQSVAIGFSHDPSSLEKGIFIWDSGAGKTEFSILGGGEIISQSVSPLGGEELDRRIQEYLERQKQIQISLSDAAALKTSFSFSRDKKKEQYLLGKDLKHTKVISFSVTNEELREVMNTFFGELISSVKDAVMELPPSLIAVIRREGILLTGGLSQLEGLETYVSQELELPVRHLPRQHISPLLGAAKLKSEWEKYSYLALEDHG